MHVTVCCRFLISFVMGESSAVKYHYRTAPPPPLQCGRGGVRGGERKGAKSEG
jgi:hypothetical protein